MGDWKNEIIIITGAACVAVGLWTTLTSGAVRAKRERHIRSYKFPATLFQKLREKHPQLERKDCQLVARALREFFLVHLNSASGYVGMPSRVVDDLWHEFILDTQRYAAFCKSAFGLFFHHTPAGSLGSTDKSDGGLRRTWRYACAEENIDWKDPTRLPLLFAIDAKLAIVNGFTYSLRPPGREATEGGGGGGSAFACYGSGLIGDADAGCGGGDGGGCGGGGE